jgi:integrase
MATLLYGAGLRLMECIRLRVKDIDFFYNPIVGRDSKALHPQAGCALYIRRLGTDGMPAYHGRSLRCLGRWRATEMG